MLRGAMRCARLVRAVELERGFEEVDRVLVVLELEQQEADREREVVLARDGEVALVGLEQRFAEAVLRGGVGFRGLLAQRAGDAEQRERVPAAQAQQRDELRERELRRDALDALGEEGEVLGAEAVERVGVGQAGLGVAARRGAEQEGDDVEGHVAVAAVERRAAVAFGVPGRGRGS